MKLYVFVVSLFISGQVLHAYGQTKTTANASPVKQNSTSAPTEVLTNKSVIALHEAGLQADMILTKIETSTCKFDLSTNSLVDLKKAGVPDAVMKAMMDKSSGKTAAGNKSESSNLKGKSLTVEMVNHPYYYATTDALKPLEKAVASTKTKYIAGGYGGVRFQYEIQSDKSTIRLPPDNSVSFLINTAGAAPELVLYKVKSEKGKRYAVAMQTKVMGGTKSNDNVMLFNSIAMGNGIYKMTPTQVLPAGEYFFAGKPVTGATTIDVYAFGID